MQKILFIAFLSIFFSVNGQNRINDKLPIISKKNNALINANGWLKNQSGQWISGKNKIPQDLGENQKLLGNYESYGLGSDNFTSLEIKDITISDSTYAILIKKYKDGFYTYSSIQKGWNNRISCKYFVFSKSELQKIKSIKNDTLNRIYFKIIYQGDLLFTNPNTFNDLVIAKDILKQVKDKTNFDYTELLTQQLGVNIYYFKTKNIVQFYFYDAFRYFLEEMNEKTNLEKDDENKYYEIDAITFKKFINF
ncbi:hypothetical protein IR010_05020 [Flavobacterium sp. MR2016-29]|uniref:hypothetical protein n=1 Tax=Flavobacterium sp. MR2016-29 TaxID=2783795 RepID=UPI00188AD336|nr:hypothetical protein [Flavobacterium sp. MR2016-29]MBF4491895.1 hypothetical protein [Flavobacterium sp. MR2016-29]